MTATNNSTDNLVINSGGDGGGSGYQTKASLDYASNGIVNGAFNHRDLLGAKTPLDNDGCVSKTIDESYLQDQEGYLDEVRGNDEDDDPLKEEVPENERTNYAQTLMNLMNGIIGSGVLSMPLAFMNGGWLLSLIVTPIIGMISCFCIHLLLSVNVSLTKRTNKSSPFDYHDVSRKIEIH